MSLSMGYCQCNFCGTSSRASVVNSFVVPLQSTVSLAPLGTNGHGCVHASAKALTETNLASASVNISREVETFKEQLSFGIDRILYGSSKEGKQLTSFNSF